MNLYIDEDSVDRELVARLRKSGHRVVTADDADLLGESDARQFTHAVREGLVVLTRNRGDFYDLHEFSQAVGGGHPGLLIVCSDNDPTRDLTPRGIVAALAKLEAAGARIAGHVHILNHWR